MESVWLESVGRSFEAALDLLAGAVRDCPDALWERPMWPVSEPGPDFQFLAPDWKPITEPALRAALVRGWVERRSAPWSVAWHALECFDYDLNGEFGPWSPPAPFAGHPHWRDLPSLTEAWSREETLRYVEYCRDQMRDALAKMTEEKAARPLPRSHRYGSQPHAHVITGMIGHTTEHAAQIRQFVTAASSGGRTAT